MVINTLGPDTTDSYRATHYWIEKNKLINYEVKLHESFEALFDKLIESEYVIMPVGYSNRKSQNLTSWVDFHFKYINSLYLENVFTLNTMTMALIENIDYKKEGIVVQSATYQLIHEISEKYAEQIVYVPSKSVALDMFLKDDYHFTICSKPVFLGSENDERKYKIIEEFNPIMIWVVYRVKSLKQYS